MLRRFVMFVRTDSRGQEAEEVENDDAEKLRLRDDLHVVPHFPEQHCTLLEQGLPIVQGRTPRALRGWRHK